MTKFSPTLQVIQAENSDMIRFGYINEKYFLFASRVNDKVFSNGTSDPGGKLGYDTDMAILMKNIFFSHLE